LRKGQLEYNRKRKSSARNNLQQSLDLLPTAEAHYLLAMIDRESGNTQSSIEHLKAAAQSNSEAGKAARRELILTDIGQNPSSYIASQAAVDSSNRVWVRIANKTDLAMQNIVISIAWLDERGQTRQGKRTYRGPLPGGEQDQLRLDLRLNNSAELDQRVRVQVTSAQVAE
jgi:hypothetical protein